MRLVAIVVVCLSLTSAASAMATVTLPIEVVGDGGTTASMTVDVPAPFAREVRSLWMQIHGLSYADMVSVQVNESPWFSLNNDTVSVAEPGKSYGGIGGGFATLSMTLVLPLGVVVEGGNTIRFRFNHTDGVASGFRVVGFNLLTGDSKKIFEPDAFKQEDPNTWTPPLRDTKSVVAGQELWENAQLKASALPNSRQIRAHCSDCHAYDGRDLKYFGFSNASIIARSRFHGLSELQGQQIASYVRSLPVPSPGRPWNPPYQPGPGLDAQPVADWAAGAGLDWVLDDDNATLPYLSKAAADPGAGKRGAFHPDGNLNLREIPISFQLPDWNHWLPQVHPMDAWGESFDKSEFASAYSSAAGSGRPSLRSLLASPDLSTLISSGRIVSLFDKWRDLRRGFLKPYLEGKGVSWTPELGAKAY